MLNTRYNNYKVLKSEDRKENRISVFPKVPNETPYRQKEFSNCVTVACSSYIPLAASLKTCKVIVLGDVSVGKTSLVNRYCHQVFNRNYKATIGVDFEVEYFEILKVPFSLQIWDTAGQERFKCIAAAYYRSAHAILTVFDFTSSSSLQHCPVWLNEALDSNFDTPFKFLVGTKKDLLTGVQYQLAEKRALESAQMMEAEFWSVSSKTGDGVKPLFHRIAALCFDQTVRMDLEESGQRSRFKLGQSLIHLPRLDEHVSKKSKCEAGFSRCNK